MTDPCLLIAWHSRTGASEALAQSAAAGAGERSMLLKAREVEPAHFLDCSGYLFVFPENLANISGEMKEMFDRCYYPVLGKLNGRPFATMIAAGSDGENAQRQVDRIAKGWRLRRVADRIIVNTQAQTEEAILAPKILEPTDLEAARELGEAMASGLAEGIF